jgi:uncharacterized protein YkwD
MRLGACSWLVLCTVPQVAQYPLRAVAVLVCIGMLACSEASSPAGPSDTGAAPIAGASEMALAIVDLTNAERARQGLAALAAESRLMRAAQLHADQMVRVGRLDHVLSEATYPRPEDRLAAAGYTWRAYAENIAFNQRGASDVMSAWMQSPGHRANILNGTFTQRGVGYARDGSGRPYYVQVFGRPT